MRSAEEDRGGLIMRGPHPCDNVPDSTDFPPARGIVPFTMSSLRPTDVLLGGPLHTQIPARVPGEHHRFWVFARVSYFVAFLAHVIFLGVFLLVDVPSLALFNVLSVTIWGGCILSHVRGHYRAPVVPALLEVSAHAALATVVLGTESGFYLYVLAGIFVPFLIPFWSTLQRWVMATAAALIFAGCLLYSIALPPYQVLPGWLEDAFVVGNSLGIGISIIAVISTYEWVVVRAEQALEEAKNRADNLLHSMLPRSVAEELKENPGTIAQRHDEVRVIFVDLVGFTELSGRMEPEAVIDLLNRVFSAFDDAVERLPVEKIKTIGDAYMAASGAPEPHADHAGAIADLALEIRDQVRLLARDDGLPLEVRIGIHSGEVMAGVIGRRKPAYDLWGDTVNTASRMEASGVPGRIQVSEATARLLRGHYQLAPRGPVEIAGKGVMETWFLEGARVRMDPQAAQAEAVRHPSR